MAPKMTKVNK